jgi:two-component system phosphate regulon sensor histidine kinase PhoR
MKRRFFWQLFLGFLVIIGVSVGGTRWYSARSWEWLYQEQIAQSLQSHAAIVEPLVRRWLSEGQDTQLQEWIGSAGRNTPIRLTVILPDGKVIADSRSDPLLMDNHANRPEVESAIHGNRSRLIRKSFTLTTTLMYWAQPIVTESGVIGVIRTALPASAIEKTLSGILWKTGWGALAAALCAALLGAFFSRRISRPLERITRMARAYAQGDMELRLPQQDTIELQQLVDAFNGMADRFSKRLQEMNIQHAEEEAILAAMSEGVLAVDHLDRLITVNQAAIDLLGLAQRPQPDGPIESVIRNISLLNAIADVRKHHQPIEQEIVLSQPEQRVIHFRATPLIDTHAQSFGVLLVMTNLTRLRRLETVRKDFVANVSHELKTPITSIKGFVETLLSGAIDEPENARHFLQILSRQVNRLNGIVDDLLSLSRIEQSMERETIEKKDTTLRDIVDLAIQVCSGKASEKAIRIERDCPADLKAPINPPLFEEALVNLVMNAIQYSKPESAIRICCTRQDGWIRIDVTDSGCGIAAEHLPRIFERFYRVDPGRSRKDGGTGLGLAIVRNIMNAHGGKVDVQSEPGKGSTFRLLVPS